MSHPVEKESHWRSIIKAFTWRILATLTTTLIAFFVMKDTSIAITVGIFDFIIKLIVYYFHERAWQLVPRGTIRGAIDSMGEPQETKLNLEVEKAKP